MNDEISSWINNLSAAEDARRLHAAENLARLGEEARGAAVPLVRAAGDASESVREWAVAALEGLGPPDVKDLTALQQMTTTTSPDDVAYWAITLVGRLGTEGAPAVPRLIEVLEESDSLVVRQRAAWALGRIGPGGADARDALQQASRSEDPRLSRLAATALQQIGF